MADTTVTVQTIIDNCIARQKDEDKNTWDDAKMLKYVNKARNFIYNLLILQQSEIGISTGTITMVAGTQEYTLSGNLDDFWCAVSGGIYFNAGTEPLKQATFEDRVRNGITTTDALPLLFYLTSTALGLIPIPTATAVAIDATIRCRYFKYQADLVLTDSMPWKNLFNESISYFIDSIAFIENEVNQSNMSAIYNTLEQNVAQIVRIREGRGVIA